MQKWRQSSLLTKINSKYSVQLLQTVHAGTAYGDKEVQALSRFLVTLKLLDIYKDRLEQEDLCSIVWVTTSNYIMGRINY